MVRGVRCVVRTVRRPGSGTVCGTGRALAAPLTPHRGRMDKKSSLWPSVARFPTEESQREQQGAKAPHTDDEHIAPVERGTKEPCLYPVGEVLHREDTRNPGDPRRCGIPERDEDP